MAKPLGKTMGLPYGVHPEDPTDAGWGVVFSDKESPAVRRAVMKLVEHRARQFRDPKKREQRLKILEYKEGEDKSRWLARYKMAIADIDPRCVPYYLLLVGGPERIPLRFGLDLDLDYCVGRLPFDRAEDFENYIESLIHYETSKTGMRRTRISYFAARHDGDPATEASADTLMRPLYCGDEDEGPAHEGTGFEAELIQDDVARRETMARTLAGNSALVFTATHGVVWPTGHARQSADQGALLCADWGGPGHRVTPETYFAASDLIEDANYMGLVAFHFACFGAGTPAFDTYFREEAGPCALAPADFVAALPQKLLSHRNGAALAVFGHVDRAWASSFQDQQKQKHLLPFRNLIKRILSGCPVGLALEDFNQRCVSYSAFLQSLRKDELSHIAVSDEQWSSSWRIRNDAQGYALLGDPAARVGVELSVV
jgi:hypothetical protein